MHLSPWNTYYLWVFIDILYKLDEYPLFTIFLRVLNFVFMDECWILSNIFFYIYWAHYCFVLFCFSICCYSKLNWLVLSVEPDLHSQDKPHLVMIDCLFVYCFIKFASVFEIFCCCVVEGYWSVVSCNDLIPGYLVPL